jgi:hypothetical protein
MHRCSDNAQKVGCVMVNPIGRRVTKAVALGMLGVIALAGVAAAGQDVRMKVSKHEGGPYSETLRLNLDSGQAKNLYLRVQNQSVTKERAALLGPIHVSDYTFKYFTANGTNISDEVAGGLEGYQFAIGVGNAKKFRVRVKLSIAGPPNLQCFTPSIFYNDYSALDHVFVALNGQISFCLP